MTSDNQTSETPPEANLLLEKINKEMHELETTLNDQQHNLVTRLLAERSVLAAMRTFQNPIPADTETPVTEEKGE
jgi:hypothetical protein